MYKWFNNLIDKYYNENLGNKWQEYYVFNLTFDGDTVSADVKYHEDYYYVSIKFRQFTIHEKDKLLSVCEKEENKRDLLKGNVPQDLFDCGVDIFPQTSIDFIVDCGCWSSNLLCNHAVAVLHRVSNIFKENPSLIFSLKGLDLNSVDRFPTKSFDDIFNNSYDNTMEAIIYDEFYDPMDILRSDLFGLIENYEFKTKHTDFKLPLNLNSRYQVTNNSMKNSGDFVSFLKSCNHPLLDYTLNLIKHRDIIPEIFMIDDEHVHTRWIPSKDIDIDYPEKLITVNNKSISKDDEIRVFTSLIISDFLSLLGMSDEYDDITFNLLYETSKLDSEKTKSAVSDISRELSIFTMKHIYHIDITDIDNEFVLDLKTDDDIDSLRYTYHIRKFFAFYNIYWNMNKPLRLDSRHFMKYLFEIEDDLKYLNVSTKKSFNLYETGFKIKLTLDDADFLTINNISSSSWMVDLGNRLISTEEFQELKIDDSGIFELDGDYFIADPVKFNSLKNDLMFLPVNFESYELLQIALLGRYRNLKFDVGDQFKNLLDFQGELPQPEGLKGSLRPYQLTGYSWLVQNIKSGFGSILADDMGLGKTVQVLSAIIYLKENKMLENQVLIVAPTTLITNWISEIEKFTDLTYSVYHGVERQFEDDADLILTSYGMVRSDEEQFKEKTWFLCVLDEAQNIKNPSSKQTRAIKSINAENRIALTGTPIENRLLDYWSIFDFTNHGYLKSRSEFKRQFASKKTNNRDLNNLNIMTKPFILRRLKTDKTIIDDLPDKIVNDVYCNLTDKQRKLYDELVESGLSSLEEDKNIKRKGQILKLITNLKQICNHPVQYLKKGNVNVSDSSKLELLVEIISNILDADEKVIVFTQYVEMGEIIRDVCLKKFNREVLFLHGSLKREDREKIINNFQNSKSYPILIATLKTGGVGLNLTNAQNVIHYDLWWNPAVENQATDRAYRIGQKKDVMVYRFITKGTLEEKTDLILKDKLELADRTITSSETFITELSDDELKEILELRL